MSTANRLLCCAYHFLLHLMIVSVGIIYAGGADARTNNPPTGQDPTFTIEVRDQSTQQYFIARRNAGGVIDLRFGEQGYLHVRDMVPLSIVIDDRGYLYVVGKTQGTTPRPVLQRLTPNGQLDTTWADNGRTDPMALPANAAAEHALPLGNGRVLVLGELQGMNRQAALWMVDASGRFEPRWLLLSELPSSQALSLARFGTDSVLVGLRVSRRAGVALEGHVHTPVLYGAELPEVVVRQPMPEGWSSSAVLEHRDEGWFWIDPEQKEDESKKQTNSGKKATPSSIRVVGVDEADMTLWTWQKGPSNSAPPVETAPPSIPQSPPQQETLSGGAAFNPFATSAPKVQNPPQSPSPSSGWQPLTILGFLLALLGIPTIFRLFRSPDR
ncbi:hypothetical protein [Caldimonas tepidiphila]|uniref:hypothetical protein n=1 Tax=Caldimonas tepidiphila TaxID=2315841 RepID=UPI0013007FA0|nr:hypothetical protein [Caldimonas tepidiphila]